MKYIGYTLDNQGRVCEYTDPQPTRDKARRVIAQLRTHLMSRGAVIRTRRADKFDPSEQDGLRIDPCMC